MASTSAIADRIWKYTCCVNCSRRDNPSWLAAFFYGRADRLLEVCGNAVGSKACSRELDRNRGFGGVGVRHATKRMAETRRRGWVSSIQLDAIWFSHLW